MVKNEQIITIPDIGTDGAVEVIEINVKIGDTIDVEDTLITLESEKASMDIPAPQSGIIKSILVKVGDKVQTGSQIITLEIQDVQNDKTNDVVVEEKQPQAQEAKVDSAEHVAQTKEVDHTSKVKSSHQTESKTIAVNVPDIGTDSKVEVIEVSVKKGDVINAEDPLITLESEKASMEIPSPAAGTVEDIKIKVGDKISYGDLILHLTTQVITETTEKNTTPAEKKETTVNQTEVKNNSRSVSESNTVHTPFSTIATTNQRIYASPSIRRFANELGVDLSKVSGAGRKGRITKTDIEKYVKTELTKIQSGTHSTSNGLNIIPMPEVDYKKFGEVSTVALTRIKKLSAANLHRNWVSIPHVTQFDEADITEMEEFRVKYKKQAEERGYKLTPLVFLMRAAAQALKLVPQFNVSLSNDGNEIIQKHYYHIGIAVDTPNGLVVPVIRDVDQKGLFQLAQELAEISLKAREGKLQAKDMQGGCFTISSLGGIGGTAFTPIINAPEVAILGVSKSQMKPIYQKGEFVPRLMLPLSLSYDHRAIDGAGAARFITVYSQLLGDISQLLL